MSSDTEVWKQEEWLVDEYVVKERSTNEIADDFDVNAGAIHYWIKKYGIDTRSKSEARSNGDVTKLQDGEWLKKQYVANQKSTVEIGEKLNLSPSTVQRYLEEHGIETRQSPTGKSNADFEKLNDESCLRDMYHSEGMSIQDIADSLGTYYSTVYNRFEEFDIERRDNGGVKDFDTDKLNDKSYLRSQYVEERATLQEIASECGCSIWVIVNRLDKYEIERRSRGVEQGRSMPAISETQAKGDIKKLQDEDWLRKQYHHEEKSTGNIAEMLCLNPTTVYQYLVKYDIERRDRIESLPRGKEHHQFKNQTTIYYGPNWDEKKLERRIIDQCRCQVCGKTDAENIEKNGRVNSVHHIQPRSNFIRDDGTLDYESANQTENLITVCDQHHNRIEGVPIDNRS